MIQSIALWTVVAAGLAIAAAVLTLALDYLCHKIRDGYALGDLKQALKRYSAERDDHD